MGIQVEEVKMIDIIKLDRPQQFPKDEIVNESDRLVRSWVSAEIKDKQGDIIPVSELKRTLNTWFKRGATMIDQHSNRPIGKGLSWKEMIEPKSGKPGILLDWQVYDDYSVDHQVWEEIKAGDRQGLSIGGRATGKPKMKQDDYTGGMGKELSGIELYEISPVDGPANQLATNVAINYLAKSDKGLTIKELEQKLMADLQKGYAAQDISKPFGGFETFEACTMAQEERGHSEESAKRICGWLKHRTEKKFMNDTTKENYEEENSLKKITAEEESETINENKKKADNMKEHKFKAAHWTHKNGHPRCIRCGGEERTDGQCDPETHTLPKKKENKIIKALMKSHSSMDASREAQKNEKADWPASFTEVCATPKHLKGSVTKKDT